MQSRLIFKNIQFKLLKERRQTRKHAFHIMQRQTLISILFDWMCCIFQNITFTSFFSFRTLYLSDVLLNIPWRSKVNNVSNKDPTQIHHHNDAYEPLYTTTQLFTKYSLSFLLICSTTTPTRATTKANTMVPFSFTPTNYFSPFTLFSDDDVGCIALSPFCILVYTWI